jgi:hypothetical protein
MLDGPITNCATGWLRANSLLSPAPISLLSATVAWSATGTAAPSADDENNESAIGSRPSTPAPGPAPGGASGAAAVGGSGVGLSAFITLTGLLLLAAPRALRRLRLSCEPWLTAFFVLIPERPG